jgi:hypothetical protein
MLNRHPLGVAAPAMLVVLLMTAQAVFADCTGHCGGQSPDGCWCDEFCFMHDDCCENVCDACPGFSACSPDPSEHCCTICPVTHCGCWCDHVCIIFGDCCTDVCMYCDHKFEWCGAPRNSCVGLCGTSGAASGDCACDDGCIDRGDCCNDACQTCGICKPGDLNHDGVVDVADLLILFDNWGECPDPDDCPADLNGDGIVNVADLLILFDNWG